MGYEYTRNIRDAAKVGVLAVPAAAANASGAAIDLEQVQGGILENVQFEIAIPALPSLADAKSLTVTVQDSADGTTFANLDPSQVTTVTGVSTSGSAAKTVRFRIPPQARRYIGVNLAVAASGGDSTAKSVTLSALF
jgi:hypothetical protein